MDEKGRYCSELHGGRDSAYATLLILHSPSTPYLARHFIVLNPDNVNLPNIASLRIECLSLVIRCTIQPMVDRNTARFCCLYSYPTPKVSIRECWWCREGEQPERRKARNCFLYAVRPWYSLQYHSISPLEVGLTSEVDATVSQDERGP